jgi:hypothetical protein
MKKNVGQIDKIVRIVSALIMLTFYFTGLLEGTLGLLSLIISVVFLLTAIVGFCPLYRLIGLNTCKL